MFLRNKKPRRIVLALLAALSVATCFLVLISFSRSTAVVELPEVNLVLSAGDKSRKQSCKHCNVILKMQIDIKDSEVHNAVEDAKLQHFMACHTHRQRAVIFYLANTATVRYLMKSLELLYKNFNRQFRYPVVIFCEADFLPMVELVRTASFNAEKQIFFQLVDLSVPEWYLKKFGKPPNNSCTGRSIGYRSMCRFQAKLIYEQSVMRHFEFYWRLDDDSSIMSRISFDVFSFFKNGNFSYGFIQSTIDDCAHSTFNVTLDYMKSKGISPTFFHKLKRNEVFFNNFEVSSLKFWRSQQYRDFIDHIDSLGGIYLHRWGDAPIKTLALSMHVPLHEIYRFKNISYNHPINTDLITDFLK